MTLGDLLTDVYGAVGVQGFPSPETRSYHVGLLNRGQRAILREPGLARLRDTLNPLTFDSEADRAIYGLPSSLARVTAITERDGNRHLSSASLAQIRTADPGLDLTGDPWAFVPLGYRLLQEPPASTGLWAESASASDTQTLTHAGIRSGGLQTGDISTTLTGVTRVALGSLTDYVDVQSLTLSLKANGIISIFDASTSGNTLAQIGIGERTPQYFVIQLYPTPTGAVTFYVDGQLRVPSMVEDTDIPVLPEEFHDLTSDYAQMLHWEKVGDSTRLIMSQQRTARGLGRLKYYVAAHGTDHVLMSRGRTRGYNRYDALTPAEDWS